MENNDLKYNEVILEKPKPESIGSRIMGGMTKLGDLVILNWAWIITSLPIITIGASTTALYSTFYNVNRNYEANVLKQFFINFKDNFKQSTIAWLITLIGYFIAACDCKFAFYGDRGTSFTIVFGIIFLFTFIVVSFTTTLMFPLIARYKNSLRNHIKNSFALSGFCFFYTLIMVSMLFFPMVLTFYSRTILKLFGWIWLLCGFAFVFYVNSIVAMNIFKRIKSFEENGE